MGQFSHLSTSVVLVRVAGIAALTYMFIATQHILGAHKPVQRIVDFSHELTESWNLYVRANPIFADQVMIISSLLVDLSVLYLTLASFFAKSWRTAVATATVIIFRQICQFTIEFPIPEGLYFKHPGFPSLFVTYDVKTDFFFSGHTSLMVTCAIDMVRRTGSKVLFLSTVFLCLFQMGVVLIFRFHYIPDVITALFAAFAADYIGGKYAPKIERFFYGHTTVAPPKKSN